MALRVETPGDKNFEFGAFIELSDHNQLYHGVLSKMWSLFMLNSLGGELHSIQGVDTKGIS